MSLSDLRLTCIGPAFSLLMMFSTASQAADDKSTISSVTDMLGITTDKHQERIDYSERPKLVMPPKTNVLPAPRDRNGERPSEWPVDAEIGVRRTDRFARDPNAPVDNKPKPSMMERIRGPRDNTAAGADDEPGLFQRVLKTRQQAAEHDSDEPARKLLAEPPNGYRHPTQPLSNVKDTGRKKGYLESMFGGGGGSDSDPVAQTAGTSEAMEKPKSADSSNKSWGASISSMLPSFFKSSEKN